MNDSYPWATNEQKLELSIVKVRENAKIEQIEFSEEAVKEEYVRRGGLLVNEDGSKGPAFAENLAEEAPIEEEEDLFAETEDDIPAKPKAKKGAKK